MHPLRRARQSPGTWWFRIARRTALQHDRVEVITSDDVSTPDECRLESAASNPTVGSLVVNAQFGRCGSQVERASAGGGHTTILSDQQQSARSVIKYN